LLLGLALSKPNSQPNQSSKAIRKDLEEWKKQMKTTHRALTRGAILEMPIKDWESDEDRQYAIRKYTHLGFDYDGAAAAKAKHIADMNQHLNELDNLLHSEESANKWGRSMDDILLIPDLRTLTAVKGLQWPKKVKAYVEKSCRDAGVSLYTEHAV